MIYKGSESAGVIDVAMNLGASCVMGNHKQKAIVKPSEELHKMGKKRAKWIKQCPHILRAGKPGKMGEVEMVHAGLVPGKRLKR